MKKVLIIEDDSFLLDLEAAKIKKNNYDVLVAQTGEDGMKKIKEPDLGIILLDLLLPNYDGYEILKKVRADESTKKIPVIVFSNCAEQKDIDKAMELGANKFMVKSNFSLEELVEEMGKLIL